MQKDRLKKLAEAIEALEKKDSALIQKTVAIAALRRQAAVELHAICAAFVEGLNRKLSSIQLEFDPSDYAPEAFQDIGINLLQINVRGRILQIEFACTPQTVSTENFRVPHVLEGSVRCFNQEFLDRAVIEEQFIFYCLEKEAEPLALLRRPHLPFRTLRSGIPHLTDGTGSLAGAGAPAGVLLPRFGDRV